MSRPIKTALIAIAIVAVLGVLLYYLYGSGGVEYAATPMDLVSDVKSIFQLSSKTFSNNSFIPRRHTLDGDNLSPPLSWRGIPRDAVALTLIMYDPDAPGGIFYHWLLYNIPPNIAGLPEGLPRAGETQYGLQGRNDYGDIGYGGPYPPEGSRHRYIFLLLALDRKLDLAPGASPAEILEACRGHVIAYSILIGYYER